MYEKIILALKGALIGIANIIPGVSGGTLAITLGLYEKIIHAINTFFKNLKNNVKFLLPIGIGAILGLLLVSNIIVYLLDNYPVPTTIFFAGLILGGLPLIVKKVKDKKTSVVNIIIFLVIFIGLISLSFVKQENNIISLENLTLAGYIKLLIVGVIAAATMVIPGISGSFVLMLLGYYRPILNVVSALTNFSTINFDNFIYNIIILGVFGIGILLGILIIAKILEYLFQKYETPTYYAIIGFILGSIFIIVKPLISYDLTALTVIMSIIFGAIGYIIAYFLGER